MKRDRLTDYLCKFFGIRAWNKIQMWLKFHQSFSELYKGKAINPPARCYVYVADGRTVHGGLSDRIRGILSIYEYCKDRDLPFKINFYSPFRLELFLVPNKYDWKLKEGEFVRNRSVGFRFFNTYSKLDDPYTFDAQKGSANYNSKLSDVERKSIYFELLDSRKQQVHCYSNVTLDEKKMNVLFNELFKPSKILQESIDNCLNATGGVLTYLLPLDSKNY